MAAEKSPSWRKNRVYLDATGPQAVGNRPSAVAPPSRPVKRNSGSGTNTRTVERPVQGVNVGRNAGSLS